MIKFFKNKILLITAFIFLLLIGGYTYQRIISSEEMVKGDKSYKVKREKIKDSLSLSGEIDAEEKATLKFQSSGMMTWVGVKEGDYVKKYQGIASLDRVELEKNLKKYLNTYMKTRWDFETARDTNDIKNIGGFTTDAREAALRALDKAQFDLDNSVLDVELKDIALKYAYLYTPIEGIVTRVDAPYSGVNITPSTAEFEIINPKTIYFSATVDQNDVIQLKDGMVGNVTIDPYPDKRVMGIIKSISFSPKTDETGTVYQVKVTLNEDDLINKYRLAMTGDIEFEIGQGRYALFIPSEFIKSEKEEKIVYRQVNGKKIKTVIKTGEILDSLTEVTSGLSEGDIVVN